MANNNEQFKNRVKLCEQEQQLRTLLEQAKNGRQGGVCLKIVRKLVGARQKRYPGTGLRAIDLRSAIRSTFMASFAQYGELKDVQLGNKISAMFCMTNPSSNRLTEAQCTSDKPNK